MLCVTSIIYACICSVSICNVSCIVQVRIIITYVFISIQLFPKLIASCASTYVCTNVATHH